MKTKPAMRSPSPSAPPAELGQLSKMLAAGARGGRGYSRLHGAGDYRLSSGDAGGRSLDASKIEAAYVGYHKTLNDRLRSSQQTAIYQNLFSVQDTDNLVDLNVFISSVPRMRPWLGDKVLNKLRTNTAPIYTSAQEASVEVPKRDILNDRLGLYRDAIAGMGSAYNWAIDQLVIGYLVAGIQGVALGTTYDGQNLIDIDHTHLSVGGTQQSNKVTGALSSATYNQAFVQFLGLKDDNGIPINIAGRRMTLVVGPANRSIARTLIDAEALASGASNLDRGTANLIVTPYLTPSTITVKGPSGPVSITITGNEWFLIPEGSTAVIVQKRRGPEFLSVEEGEFCFRTGKYLYGIEAEFGAGYGLWQDVAGGPGV